MYTSKKLINDIIEIVYTVVGISEDDGKSKKRNREIIIAKNIAVLFVKEITKLPFRELSRLTPKINRKTSSNRHGYITILNDIKTDDKIKDYVTKISNLIAMSIDIPNEVKHKYFKIEKKLNKKSVNAYEVTDEPKTILLPLSQNDLTTYLCIDSQVNSSMIGKEVDISKAKLKQIKYDISNSPLEGTYLFKLFRLANKL